MLMISNIRAPIDGSARSLKALYHANYLFRGTAKVRIYLLHVIVWTDENEENIDMNYLCRFKKADQFLEVLFCQDRSTTTRESSN